jgi:hypothetical protein
MNNRNKSVLQSWWKRMFGCDTVHLISQPFTPV